MEAWNYTIDITALYLAAIIALINIRNFLLTRGHKLVVDFRYGSLVEWSKPNVMYATPVSPMLIENKKNKPEIITKIFIELNKNNQIELVNYESDPIVLEPLKAQVLFFEPISYFTKNNEKWKIDDIGVFKKSKIFLKTLDKKILARERNRKYNREKLSPGDYMGLWKDEIPKRKNRPKPNPNIFTPVSIRSATKKSVVYSGNITCAIKGLDLEFEGEVEVYMDDLKRIIMYNLPENWRHTLISKIKLDPIRERQYNLQNLLIEYKSAEEKNKTASGFMELVKSKTNIDDTNPLKEKDLYVDSVYTPPEFDRRDIEDDPYIAFEFPQPIKLSRGKKKKG